MLKIDVTRSQKKIIIISCSVLLIFVLFWVFLYFPAAREISSLRSELASTDTQIQGIEMLLSGSGSRDEAIRLLKQEQQYLNEKFPQKEEESLRLIPEFARKNNIEVVSLQPGPKTEFIDESGKPQVIEGKTAYYLPIAMELTCSYKDMVTYLLELKNNLPAFISVINLNVKKDSQFVGKVRVSILFDLYLLI
ncbi:MAG: hypothetical protein WCY09_06130 [Candidatus Omnitrophota bacterium]